MAVIYLFRHGQTHYNKNRIFTGLKDSKLTPEGVRQAKAIASLLKDKKINIAYFTRLSRSRDTLSHVLKNHPECKTLIKDNRMIERDYGKLSGLAHRTVIDQFGQKQFDTWHRGYYLRPPGGESFADVGKRVGDFIADLKKNYAGQDVNIAISAHGNSIRLFKKIMDKASVADTVSWTIPYDQYFEYKI